MTKMRQQIEELSLGIAYLPKQAPCNPIRPWRTRKAAWKYEKQISHRTHQAHPSCSFLCRQWLWKNKQVLCWKARFNEKHTKFLLAFFPFNEFEKKILLFHIVIWQSWQKAIANRYDVITQAFLTFQREKVCGKTIVYDSHYFVVQKASGGNVMSHCEYFDKISILNHQQTTIERMWHHIKRFL